MATATKRNVEGLFDEELINVKELPNILAPRHGKKVHMAAIYRWFRTGLSGVKLETILIANERFTTQEALRRFWVRVTEARDGSTQEPNAIEPLKATEEPNTTESLTATQERKAIEPPKKSAKKKHF